MILFPVAVLGSEKIYFMDLEYNNGKILLVDINVITGQNILSEEDNFPYKLELLSVDKDILYMGFFDIPNKLFVPPPVEQDNHPSMVELEQLFFSISMPYFKNGDTIKISRGNKKIIDISVSKLRMYCGDNKCQSDETSEECPEDCVGNVIGEKSSRINHGNSLIRASIGSVFLITISVFVIFFKRRKKQPKIRS